MRLLRRGDGGRGSQGQTGSEEWQRQEPGQALCSTWGGPAGTRAHAHACAHTCTQHTHVHAHTQPALASHPVVLIPQLREVASPQPAAQLRRPSADLWVPGTTPLTAQASPVPPCPFEVKGHSGSPQPSPDQSQLPARSTPRSVRAAPPRARPPPAAEAVLPWPGLGPLSQAPEPARVPPPPRQGSRSGPGDPGLSSGAGVGRNESIKPSGCV